MGKSIERVTMLKVSDTEARKKILDQYVTLKKTAVKVSHHHLPAVGLLKRGPFLFVSLESSHISSI